MRKRWIRPKPHRARNATTVEKRVTLLLCVPIRVHVPLFQWQHSQHPTSREILCQLMRSRLASIVDKMVILPINVSIGVNGQLQIRKRLLRRIAMETWPQAKPRTTPQEYESTKWIYSELMTPQAWKTGTFLVHLNLDPTLVTWSLFFSVPKNLGTRFLLRGSGHTSKFQILEYD
jgi:hypothetical protein